MNLEKDLTVRCNYTIPKSIVDKLDTFALKNNVSRSHLIAKLLEQFLDSSNQKEDASNGRNKD